MVNKEIIIDGEKTNWRFLEKESLMGCVVSNVKEKIEYKAKIQSISSSGIYSVIITGLNK